MKNISKILISLLILLLIPMITSGASAPIGPNYNDAVLEYGNDGLTIKNSGIGYLHLSANVISGMTDVTSANEDYILIWDATDQTLKKCDMEEVRGGIGITFIMLTDTPADYDNGKYARSTADGVIWDDPAGAGDMTKAVYDTDTNNIVDKAETVDDGVGNSSTAADVKDAVTKKHTQNTDTQFDFYNALGSDHTWSGQKDTQPVGESVVFGDLLYFNWTDKEWKKAKADAYATCPAERIALETKGDGDDCLMLVKGYIRDESAFDFGASRIFLNDDTAGTCDDTAPEESGDQIQIVGTAIHADILFFNPSVDVGEI